MRHHLLLWGLLVGVASADPIHSTAPDGWHNDAYPIDEESYPILLKQLAEVGGNLSKPSWFDKQFGSNSAKADKSPNKQSGDRHLIFGRYVSNSAINLRETQMWVEGDFDALTRHYGGAVHSQFSPKKDSAEAPEPKHWLSPEWKLLAFNGRKAALLPFVVTGPVSARTGEEKRFNQWMESTEKKDWSAYTNDNNAALVHVYEIEEASCPHEEDPIYRLYRLGRDTGWHGVVILAPKVIERLNVNKMRTQFLRLAYIDQEQEIDLSRAFTTLDIDGDGSVDVVRLQQANVASKIDPHFHDGRPNQEYQLLVRRSGKWWLTNHIQTDGGY